MTIVVGGIGYSPPSDTTPPQTGDVDGFCCSDCRAAAMRMIREGRASVVDISSNASRRLQILQYIEHWGGEVPPSILSFLLQGGELSRPERDQLSRIVDYHNRSLNEMNTSLRIAAVYCVYLEGSFDLGFEASYEQHIRQAIRHLEHSRGFTCVSCGALSPPLPLNQQCSAHCSACRDRLYIRSNLMNSWLPRSAELVTLPYDYLQTDSEEDTVTLEWAEENLYFDEDTETWERSMPERLHLQSYSANPLDSIAWDPRNKPNALVFGVELEFESNNSSETGQRGLIRALGGNTGKSFILKGDGSLTWGVELVTTPFTLSQHKDGTGVDWKKITEALAAKAHSGTVTEHCGMHVHINKKALSALTIGKMLVFLNDSKLAPLITTIAQRGSGGYCSRSAKKLTDGTRSSESRYDIMNVSVRHPTCEVRMFRGNLALERIYKNIEFCHALVQYCRQASMRSLTDWGNFSRWLIANRGQYQNLVRFLLDKEAIGFRQLAKSVKPGEEIKHISDL